MSNDKEKSVLLNLEWMWRTSPHLFYLTMTFLVVPSFFLRMLRPRRSAGC